MAFVQIIEYTTTKIDEVRALVSQYRLDEAEETAVRRTTVTQDRDAENRYLVIVEFDSYEAAMENSSAPRTSEFAAKMAELLDAPPVFRNLDVIEQATL